jgi:cyclo(L-tyrosyl-L-tyrosyl) synthase
MFGVIGMSPGNSYFKQGVIDQLLEFGLKEYSRIGIFIPDIPAIQTYIALGYSENRARRDKAIPQGNALKNKVHTAIDSKQLDESRVRIFDWKNEDIEDNGEYRQQFEYIKKLYDQNENFRKDANAATAEVLNENPFQKTLVGEKEIEVGVHYLLSEFAFMLFLPEYLHEDLVEYTYHRPWPVFEKLIAGAYTGEPMAKIGFRRFPEFL